MRVEVWGGPFDGAQVEIDDFVPQVAEPCIHTDFATHHTHDLLRLCWRMRRRIRVPVYVPASIAGRLNTEA